MFSVNRFVEESNSNSAFYVGCDLGQSQDYTAICIIEKLPHAPGGSGPMFHVRKLERTRGTPYPRVVSRLKTIMQRLPTATLVVDATGCGLPVIDLLKQEGLRPIAILIHGGDRATAVDTVLPTSSRHTPSRYTPRTWRVPKRDLVACVQVLMQNRRLQIAPGPLADVLAAELANFKIKIDPVTAHDSYSAWREAEHDDLVLSVALALWWAQCGPKPQIITKAHFAAGYI